MSKFPHKSSKTYVQLTSTASKPFHSIRIPNFFQVFRLHSSSIGSSLDRLQYMLVPFEFRVSMACYRRLPGTSISCSIYWCLVAAADSFQVAGRMHIRRNPCVHRTNTCSELVCFHHVSFTRSSLQGGGCVLRCALVEHLCTCSQLGRHSKSRARKNTFFQFVGLPGDGARS